MPTPDCKPWPRRMLRECQRKKKTRGGKSAGPEITGARSGQAARPPLQALKELPQPQVLFTLGLLNLNPAPSSVSM